MSRLGPGSRRAAVSAAARRLRNRPWARDGTSAATCAASAAGLSLLLLAACTGRTEVPRPSLVPSIPSIASSTTERPIRPSAGPGDASPAAVSPAASDRTDLVPAEPSRLLDVTLVCDRWGPDPPATIISCNEAARLALAALRPTPTTITRLDVGYGEWCVVDDAPCGDRSATVTWVVARTGAGETIRLRLARAASGEIAVSAPVNGPRVRPVSFDPPPRVAPSLGDDAPTDLAVRDPYGLCGEEDLGTSETFDRRARGCFLTGVLAGSRVELDSRATSTEGDSVLAVYRYGGSGSIRRFVQSVGGWSAAACGIEPIATPAVFEMAGGCLALAP